MLLLLLLWRLCAYCARSSGSHTLWKLLIDVHSSQHCSQVGNIYCARARSHQFQTCLQFREVPMGQISMYTCVHSHLCQIPAVPVCRPAMAGWVAPYVLVDSLVKSS